jgi:hypothetical protein
MNNYGTPRPVVPQRPSSFAAGLTAIACSLTLGASAQTFFSDPSGDSRPSAPLSFPIPDVITVGGGYDANWVYMSAIFQPGTLNHRDLGFAFEFDVDQDPLTGYQYGDRLRGVDYWVWFNTSANRSEGQVWLMSPYTQVGTVPVSLGQDSLSIRVPLSLLGNDDGVLNFGFEVGEPSSFNPQSSFSVYDEAPDYVPGAILTTATTPIPEPQTVSLEAFGLALLFLVCLRAGANKNEPAKV